MSNPTEGTEEQLEELTNELIAVIWPVLDSGRRKEEVEACVYNVLDSWTPKEKHGK